MRSDDRGPAREALSTEVAAIREISGRNPRTRQAARRAAAGNPGNGETGSGDAGKWWLLNRSQLNVDTL